LVIDSRLAILALFLAKGLLLTATIAKQHQIKLFATAQPIATVSGHPAGQKMLYTIS